MAADMRSVDMEIVDQRGYRAGWSTTIWAKGLEENKHPLDDGDVVQFSFHKGNPELAVLIVAKLVLFCGPLVLIADTDCSPLLISEGIDLRQAVNTWCRN